jgi:tetratricopeptide (TPR) repeat protein
LASNKEKLIAAAQKLVEKGQFDKAIKEYQKVVAEDGEDVRVWLKIGDLHAKLNRPREAAETYQRVAQYYSDKGHYLKAVAVFKQILKIEPRMVEVNQRLAEMYKQLGLISDAMQQYEIVANHFQKEGRSRDALAAMKQIAELDPDNIAVRIKLAELYSKEQMSHEAIDEFSRAAEYLHDHQRYDDYMKVAERLLFHAPDNRPISRELARLYISKGDPRRALPKLQVVLKADANDVEALMLLSQAFEVLGQTTKSVSVLKELARIHNENGSRHEHTETLRRILKVAPDDAEAAAQLAAVAPVEQQPVVEAPENPTMLDEDAVLPSDDGQEDPGQDSMAPGPTFLEDAAEESTVTEASADEEIGKILTETDVYIKYGLHAKALEHVQKVFRRVPDHVEAREKVVSIYSATQHIDEAVNELFILAKQMAGTPRAGDYLREILELQPGNNRARSLLTQGTPMPTPGPIRLAPVPIRTVIDEPELTDDPVAPEPVAEEMLTLDDSSLVEEEDPYAEAIEAALAADQHLPVMEAEPEITPDTSDLPSLGRDPGNDMTAGARPANVLRAVHTLEMQAAQVVAERPEGGSLEDDLDEADFFTQQNLFDEAREILHALLERYPSHPLVTAKLRDVDAMERAANGVEEPAPQAFDAQDDTVYGDAEVPQDEPVAGAESLVGDESIADEPMQPVQSVPESTSVVPEPGRNVVERGVTPEDFETHYDLGIAYKEMGLIDDAVAEFNIVMQDPAREVQCHMMLGLCYAEKGLMTDAIAQYKEGLYAEHIQEREQLALYYELGQAYERLSDGREALYYYEKVVKRDGHFRDVERRVAELRGGSQELAVNPGLPGESEVEAAFDGMLGEEQPPVNEARGK